MAERIASEALREQSSGIPADECPSSNAHPRLRGGALGANLNQDLWQGALATKGCDLVSNLTSRSTVGCRGWTASRKVNCSEGVLTELYRSLVPGQKCPCKGWRL
eukprot:363452-Chlamydomonas_euryale.AAC.5